MDKRVWEQPVTLVQKFEANEYVAACESGTTYWFQCDAGSVWSGDDKVYEETNGIDGLQTGRGGDKRSRTYYACDKAHEVQAGEKFLNGYVVQDMGWVQEDKVIPVLIWTEGGTNTHCTTQLHPENWEVAKS